MGGERGGLCTPGGSTLLPATALIFDGSTNPAHPKHIGSIDPNCNISEVVKGKPARVCPAGRWPIVQRVWASSPWPCSWRCLVLLRRGPRAGGPPQP